MTRLFILIALFAAIGFLAGQWLVSPPADELPKLLNMDDAGKTDWLDRSVTPTSKVVIGNAPAASPSMPHSALTPQNTEPQGQVDFLTRLTALLQSNQFIAAMNAVNAAYADLDSGQLDKANQHILQRARELYSDNQGAAAERLLELYVESFDQLDGWRLLAEVLADNSQWRRAVDVTARLASLENDPQDYQSALLALVRAASYVRAAYEARGDELAILALYQKIYDMYPNYPRFQLELALAYSRLGDIDSAEAHFQAILYDPELGPIAAQQLERHAAQRTAAQAEQQAVARQQIENYDPSQIVVPLRRAGSSLLVDTQLNSKRLTLLLDTGASVTALSRDTIASLGLNPTGQTIRLSTANGITSAQLYEVESLQLGNINLQNHIVAEIDLPRQSSIQGLLGTDIMRRLNDRYSYVIDNEKTALIFRNK